MAGDKAGLRRLAQVSMQVLTEKKPGDLTPELIQLNFENLDRCFFGINTRNSSEALLQASQCYEKFGKRQAAVLIVERVSSKLEHEGDFVGAAKVWALARKVK